MTDWTDFVKAFAAKNGISYGCALSDPKCSAEYGATKAPKKAPAPKSFKAILKKGMPKEVKEVKAPKAKKSPKATPFTTID